MAVNREQYNKFLEFMKEYNLINPMHTTRDSFILSNILNMTGLSYDKDKDILMLNAKVDKNGNNAFEKLVDKYFFKGFNKESLLGNSRLALFPVVSSEMAEDGRSRFLRFSYFFSLVNLSEGSVPFDQLPQDELECAEFVRKILISNRNGFNDVLKNGEASPYYDNVKSRFGSVGLPITQGNLEKNRDLFSNLIYVVRNIKINLSEGTKIPEEEFVNCFDIDKFFLVFCKCCIENCYYCEKIDDALHNCFAEAYQYLECLKNCGLDNGSYNPMIRYYDYKDNKIKFYTIRELKRDVEKLYKKYKNRLTTLVLSNEEAERLDVIHNVENFEKLVKISSKQDADIISADWDILAPGELDEEQIINRRKSNRTRTVDPNKQKVNEEEIRYRKMVFEKTNYVTKILGKDKFAGYIGYMYENGLVVFEKFYEDYECTIPANSNATYIMNINNFVEFTKLNKQEIIKMIKDTSNTDIDRKYHSKNWESRILRIIAGVDYNPEAKMFIESLVKQQKEKEKSNEIKK